MKGNNMRYLAICLAIFGALLLSGCGGNFLQPTISIPFGISDFTTVGTSPAGFYHQYVNAQADTEWSNYAGRIAGYDGVHMTMNVANSDAAPATVDVYISDNGGFTSPAQVLSSVSAKKLLTLTIPAGTNDVDSGWQPLSEDAGAVLKTANFTLYALGTPANLNLTCTNVKLEGKFRINIL